MYGQEVIEKVNKLVNNILTSKEVMIEYDKYSIRVRQFTRLIYPQDFYWTINKPIFELSKDSVLIRNNQYMLLINPNIEMLGNSWVIMENIPVDCLLDILSILYKSGMSEIDKSFIDIAYLELFK